jgi:hypothetical protein
MTLRKPKIWLQFLLLAAFSYWATGVAQFIHEKVEHGHGVVETTLPVAGAKPLPGKSQAPEPDDHDDCATCQSLKVMKAAPIAPPMLAPEPTLLRHAAPLVLEREAPVLSFVVFIPSRAPPGEASLIGA